MWNLLIQALQPCLVRDDAISASGSMTPPPPVTRQQLTQTNKDINAYTAATKQGQPVPDEVKTSLGKDIFEIEKHTDSLSDHELDAVMDIEKKVHDGQPLTKGDLQTLKGVVEHLKQELNPSVRAAEKHFKTGQDHYNKAQALEKSGDKAGADKEYTRAEAEFRLAVQTLPGEKQDGPLRGAQSFRKPDHSLDQISADLHYNLAKTLDHLGHGPEALKQYNEFLGKTTDTAEAARIADRVRELHGGPTPSAAAAEGEFEAGQNHYNKGKELEKSGDKDGAGKEYAQAAAQFHKAIANTPGNRVEVKTDMHYNLAKTLEAQGNKDGAVKEYNQFLHTTTDVKAATETAQHVRDLGGQPSQSIVDAMALSKSGIEHYDKAKTLAAQGDKAGAAQEYAQAANDFKQALQSSSVLGSAAPKLHFDLAKALEGQGLTESAASEYYNYAEMNPNAPDAGEAREKAHELNPGLNVYHSSGGYGSSGSNSDDF